ncbi:unnamed protein product [Bursaphelenchus okinawaensis]|uniref:F-box domain-containing protein n=1 Tax=Bursaphelenchus okinawaensis TaxID=465554 RepID=A0A811KNA5_9BILA|nr:unnamed protein product [Bursaphelenchus okinawaensis]CAG9108235.1 unnamed protein product [Bursaphelenchus okinawaensis]
MDTWLGRLPQELWRIIFEHIQDIDRVANAASIHKSFYKWINRDFKAMCYRNGIYRFKGETWATAFSLIKYRSFELRGQYGFNCSRTGKAVFMQHFTQKVRKIMMINDGARLIVDFYDEEHNNMTVYFKHRYMPLVARLPETLYIKDMVTDQVFELCNVPRAFFTHCFFEEAGLIYIKNKAKDTDGYMKIRFYDLKTRQKVYERIYYQDKDNWCIFSNYAIYNTRTTEYVVYNSKKKRFSSRFISCQHPEYYKKILTNERCFFTNLRGDDGHRCIDCCLSHYEPFAIFFDYTRDKLRLTKIKKRESVMGEQHNCSICQVFGRTSEINM